MGLSMHFCEDHCGPCAAMWAKWTETPTWRATMARPEQPYCGGELPDECSKCMEELDIDNKEELNFILDVGALERLGFTTRQAENMLTPGCDLPDIP